MPWLYAPMLKALRPYAKKFKSLVDIGCGDGYLLELIHGKFSQLNLAGIDVDPFMIQQAKKLPFRFYKKRVEDFSSATDIIIANLALHHFKNPKRILKKLYSLSKHVLIVADQLRPSTVKELKKRLRMRNRMIGVKDVEYYKKSEEVSILEAYSKGEVVKMIKGLHIPYKIFFYDKDYYQRAVIIFEK